MILLSERIISELRKEEAEAVANAKYYEDRDLHGLWAMANARRSWCSILLKKIEAWKIESR
jgi:hypothetical protein